jgi:bifunctional UDP-N-acetylglucosamine pyrophosphorylase/glucosamine-1-phosphate N-acetyltransferase
VVQEEQHGTGHATRVALEALTETDGELEGTVLVLFGDTPLLSTETMSAVLDAHHRAGRAVTVLTAILDEPRGYGRIIRQGDSVVGIVEQKDATLEQAAIREVNSGVFAFDAKVLRDTLSRLNRNNKQGEEYLTDALGIAAADGLSVGAHVVEDWHETLGINDRVQLAEMRGLLNRKLTEHWMREGVSIIDPATTQLDVQVTLGRDAIVHPNTQLHGGTVIAPGAEIGPNCTLTDTYVGEGARVTNATTEHLPAPRHEAGARGQGGRLRGDEERGDRRGLEGAAPVLRGRRDHRRGLQHRRGHHHRQLRRRGQAPHRDRRPRVRRLGHGADRPGQARRRRVRGRRLGRQRPGRPR